jgi:hypothetical protein
VSVPGPAVRLKKPFGCGYIVFPLILVTFGLSAVTAARQLAPQTTSDAAVFRSDPSCAPDASADTPSGACSNVPATITVAEMRDSGNGKTRVHSPMVYLRYADGTFHEAELDGSSGDVFVYSVAPGASARAQLFRGELVRVTAGKDSAETVSAPDVNAKTVGEMPWVGATAIVLALLILGLRIYVMRRPA